MVKKLIAGILSFALVFSMAGCVFASDSHEPSASSSGVEIVPFDATQGFSFLLDPTETAYSADTYYIENEDAMLKIESCTWQPASQTIWIGFYSKVDRMFYHITRVGGNASGSMNSNGRPNGDYYVIVKNMGSQPITGAIQYSVR